MKRWLTILLSAAKNWNADDAFKHSAAVAFYTLFSLAPITIIAVGVAGFFFGEETATRQLHDQMGRLMGAASVTLIEEAMKAGAVENKGWAGTVIGVALLIVGATTVFGQLQGSLNEIWGVIAKPGRSGWAVMIAQRVVSFAMVLIVGFLLLTSLVVTTALAALVKFGQHWITVWPWMWSALDVIVGLLVISLLFALLFKVLPDVVLTWREVWRGAFLTAVLFSVGRYLIALYLGRSGVASAYGAAGSLVALLIWVYYSCAILFFGVEFIRARRIRDGVSVEPKQTAVRVRREIVETTPAA